VHVDVGVELGDLVRVLAWGWHLDRACPVEVIVAQGVGQLLHVRLAQAGVVLGHVEVGWQHAALGAGSRRHVEVELL